MDAAPLQSLQHWLAAAAINAALIAAASRVPLLTPAGWAHAAALGTVLWGCMGPAGWLAVVAYLALGSLVTRLGFAAKAARGLAEARGGRRGPENVWGSAATGALLALLMPLVNEAQHAVLLVGFAASFAAKLADTFGSEIGKRWGKHTVLITSLRPVAPGSEGAISLEGTAASLVGGLLMAVICAGLGLLHGLPSGTAGTLGTITLVTVVALLATLLESVIGATLQQRCAWLSNELVNALQTALAALLAMAAAAVL